MALPFISRTSFVSVKEAILVVVQVSALICSLFLIAFTCLASLAVENENDHDPQELKNLLEPQPHGLIMVALLLCFICSVAYDPKTTSGSVSERYCTGMAPFELAEYVAVIFTNFWLDFKIANWRTSAIISLCIAWCGALPFYLVLNRRPRRNTLRDTVIVTTGELSVRFYFTWLTCTLILELLGIAQYIHGSIFDYNVYTQVMIIMLVLAFVTYGRTRDPAVGLAAMWFLGQVVKKESPFEGGGDAMETFEMLQKGAKVILPVFPLIMTLDFALDYIASAIAEVQVHAHVVHVTIC
ncbi:hypothetical protein P3T76_012430 [Phytophthora citrophthora]|uniref:Uncharacterized protein n=1 Tax=Phytophthora citrophthora TaxID=4793 RepID=A0AAD9G546_9STRA|nr:hypothetical protein P3T76_012430 [Phytophthora citrophthora]